jgi:hypothetical protein
MAAQGIAHRYLLARDYDLAMDWLWKSFKKRDPNQTYLSVPQYDPQRDNPRYQELLRRIDLPADLGR